MRKLKAIYRVHVVELVDAADESGEAIIQPTPVCRRHYDEARRWCDRFNRESAALKAWAVPHREPIASGRR